MAAPIDEGAPGYTSRAFSVFTLSNVVSEFRMHVVETDGDETDLDVWFNAPADFQNITDVRASVGSQTPKNLHMGNAISYHDQPFNKVLYDMLTHQAHCGRLRYRMVPNATVGGTFTGTHAAIDELANEANLLDSITTTTPDAFISLGVPSVPSNVTTVHEVIVRVWMAMTRNTDTGMALSVDLFSPGPITRTMLLDCPTDGTPNFRQAKINATNLSAATWNADAIVNLIAKRGAAGGTPSPSWTVYAVEILAYCEVSDITLVKSFSALDAVYASDLLDGSISSGTFRSAIMDILAHRPEAILYSDHEGALALYRCLDYSALTPTPIDISPYVLDARRYKVTEKTATAITCIRGVTVSNQASTTAEPDPYNDAGTNKLQRLAPGADPAQKYKELERPLIRSASLHKSMMDAYLELYSEDVRAAQVTCTMAAIGLDPTDIIQPNVEEIGIDAKYTCVDNTLDLDEDVVLLTLYDLDYTL